MCQNIIINMIRITECYKLSFNNPHQQHYPQRKGLQQYNHKCIKQETCSLLQREHTASAKLLFNCTLNNQSYYLTAIFALPTFGVMWWTIAWVCCEPCIGNPIVLWFCHCPIGRNSLQQIIGGVTVVVTLDTEVTYHNLTMLVTWWCSCFWYLMVQYV